MSEDTQLYTRLAAAYVRGKLRNTPGVDHALADVPLDSLDHAKLETLVRLGRAHELRLHRFKRTIGLPRVAKVLGVLKGILPNRRRECELYLCARPPDCRREDRAVMDSIYKYP